MQDMYQVSKTFSMNDQAFTFSEPVLRDKLMISAFPILLANWSLFVCTLVVMVSLLMWHAPGGAEMV